ncbi:MAG: CHAD domain-containing protein, partial [Miltoncostaeaceae bacterium]
GGALLMAKAWPVPGLRRRARFRDAAGRTIITRWREMMSYREGTLAGEDIEELHAMRVSSRRLRAAMDAFEDAFPRKPYRRFLGQVKEITDVLGDARDLDVTIERLRAERGSLDDEAQPGIDGLIGRFREERKAETPDIAALFERIEVEQFGPRLEAFVAENTGVVAAELDPRPAGEA